VTSTKSIRYPPYFLILHLARFTKRGVAWIKNDIHVPFQPELDIGGLLSPIDERDKQFLSSWAGLQVKDGTPMLTYELCAITVHLGKTRYRGHHVAFAQRWCPDSVYRWFNFDDSDVKEVSIATVLSQPAQLLVYRTTMYEVVAALRAPMEIGRTSANTSKPGNRVVRYIDVPGGTIEDILSSDGESSFGNLNTLLIALRSLTLLSRCRY